VKNHIGYFSTEYKNFTLIDIKIIFERGMEE